MNLDQELIAEAKEQLQDDMLAFSWLVQMARQLDAERKEPQNVETVIDCVVHLHGEKTVGVGNTVLKNDLCLIDAWPESGQALRARLKSATAEWRGPQHAMQLKTAEAEKLRFCFWIQLTEDYNRGSQNE